MICALVGAIFNTDNGIVTLSECFTGEYGPVAYVQLATKIPINIGMYIRRKIGSLLSSRSNSSRIKKEYGIEASLAG